MSDINATLATMANQPLQLEVSEHEFDGMGDDHGVTGISGTMDKEMLRKIKRKERNKQNRIRKRTLQKNLSQVTAANLQQSVAALATTIGGTSPSLPNDGVGYYEQQQQQQTMCSSNTQQSNSSGNTGVMNLVPDVRRPAHETAICIMDSTDANARLNHQDLSAINDYLEKCLFRDLMNISKLKIANTYLSTSKRVWVICHSAFTASWVTRRVSEMPTSNGRKFSAQVQSDMEVLTRVNVFVPKECTMVSDFNDLMRYLTVQNPGLGMGTTIPEPKQGSVMKQAETMQESETPSEVNGTHKPDEAQSVGSTDAFQEKGVDEHLSSPTKETAVKLEPVTPKKAFSALEEEKPLLMPRNRTFIMYADDTWLSELRRLNYRPYLGVRRLLCVVGERLVQRSNDQGQAKKRRRGGKRLRSNRDDKEAGEQEQLGDGQPQPMDGTTDHDVLSSMN